MTGLSKTIVRSVQTRLVNFTRRADGAVLVGDAVIPANEWASIVASMTASGEDGTTFAVALAMHVQGCAYDSEAS